MLIEHKSLHASGLMNRTNSLQHITIDQFGPQNPDDIPWLDHVWRVGWDLPDGVIHPQQTLPFPSCHIVFDTNRGAALHGCSSKRFDYDVSGHGVVLGLRLPPAAQSAFTDTDPRQLVDSSIPIEQVFSAQTVEKLPEISATTRPDIPTISEILRVLNAVARPLSQAAQNVQSLIKRVQMSPDLWRMTDLEQASDLSERQLQRLFATHLGLSPKWVIDRFRMHDALDALEEGANVDLADLAARLGFTDQAHFSNRFKAMTGAAPGVYLRRNR
ncbi:helix-turn-helix domain-containing protein [Aestuariibius sp. HNIBRBA575]|uniref:AraC family transcriptional regulator n=1 Tax=Aestuariibius sp. HNIBRBA575 TaxID=3233343 RepID=UPI0034A25FB9